MYIALQSSDFFFEEFDFELKVQIWQTGIVCTFSFATREGGNEGEKEEERGGGGGNERRRKGGEGSLAAPRIASHRIADATRLVACFIIIIGDDSLGWLID